jgi:hypothetical protein
MDDLVATDDLAVGSLTGGLLELLPAALFAAGFDAEGLAVLFAVDFEAFLCALVFAPCDFFADFAGADFAFAAFADFAAGFAEDFAGAFAAGFFAAGFGAGAASLPPTSERTRPLRLNPDFSGAAAFFDLSVLVVLFELTAIPFFRRPWIVLVRPNR